MSENYIKKNGLLYSLDLKTIIGVDDTSTAFSGRIPYGANFIEDEVFSDCPYESISLPDSMKSLGAALFENSQNLEKVKLPAQITNLPPYLFSGCSALTKITMPNELESFSEGLFRNCISLTEIPFRYGISVLPNNIFEGCTSLKSVVIPDSVVEICENAFLNCESLESLVLPSSIKKIDKSAFCGCNSIHNIRIDGNNDLFFVDENNGNLYKKNDDENELMIKISNVQNQDVSFFKENIDDEIIEQNDDDEIEDDDTFFAVEIGANENESKSFEINKDEENKMNEQINDVSVSESELNLISQTMNVMETKNSIVKTPSISNSELEQLFSKHEEAEKQEQLKNSQKNEEQNSKKRILCDTVEFSKILTFEPKSEALIDSDLFVIAEKTVTNENGEKDFSKKLIECCNSFANIHDFKQIILLSGLPFENEEFVQFFYHFMRMKNVILACEASSPSNLSDYCKKICENSAIDLEKEALLQQRKNAAVKTSSLIKMVIRDKYEN